MSTVDLRLGDCLDLLTTVESSSVDLVLTDPAYESMMRWEGIGTTARMGMGKKGSGSDNLDDKWFSVFPNENLPDLVQHIYRILRPSTHAYIMCDWETLKLLHQFAIHEGVFPPVGYDGKFEACKPLIWDKEMAGTGYTYRAQHEYVFMLWKGPKKRQLNDLGVPDILRFKKPWGKERVFPTQKPVALMELLIRQSTQPGELVLDPFMGSGTTGIACRNTGRRFVGFEKNPKTLELATSRITDELSRPPLFQVE